MHIQNEYYSFYDGNFELCLFNKIPSHHKYHLNSPLTKERNTAKKTRTLPPSKELVLMLLPKTEYFLCLSLFLE